jgi:hypothetical protein
VALANGDRRNYLLPLPPGEISQGGNHRDIYLEQQQTEKIETEVRDVDRIRVIETVRMLSRVAFWRVIRSFQSNINLYYSPQSAAPHL